VDSWLCPYDTTCTACCIRITEKEDVSAALLCS
jgi:hypothetical protein